MDAWLRPWLRRHLRQEAVVVLRVGYQGLLSTEDAQLLDDRLT